MKFLSNIFFAVIFYCLAFTSCKSPVDVDAVRREIVQIPPTNDHLESLKINISQINFGTIIIPQYSEITLFLINLSATDTITIHSVTFLSSISSFSLDIADSLPIKIAPLDTNHKIRVIFTAQGKNEGVFLDTLTFNNSKLHVIPTQAKAITAETVLVSDVNFGSVKVGNSRYMLATIVNNGNTDVVLESYSIPSGLKPVISFPDILRPITIFANSTAVLTIKFTPTEAPAIFSGIITFQFSGTSGSVDNTCAVKAQAIQ